MILVQILVLTQSRDDEETKLAVRVAIVTSSLNLVYGLVNACTLVSAHGMLAKFHLLIKNPVNHIIEKQIHCKNI